MNEPSHQVYRVPDQPREQPLSAQQMQSLAKQHADALVAIRKDVELRKWAVDQACGVAGAGAEQHEAITTLAPVVILAREIHAFLVEGVLEKVNDGAN
jgi:hypothetical protein